MPEGMNSSVIMAVAAVRFFRHLLYGYLLPSYLLPSYVGGPATGCYGVYGP